MSINDNSNLSENDIATIKAIVRKQTDMEILNISQGRDEEGRDEVRVTTGIDFEPVDCSGDMYFLNKVGNEWVIKQEVDFWVSNTCINSEWSAVPMQFAEMIFVDVFGNKNNKTLNQTLAHNRYKKLAKEVHDKYASYLDTPLGNFLLLLKKSSDPFYKLFLNRYGDLTYSKFWIEDRSILSRKGLYLYSIGNTILYIGRCLDSFKKRINHGYGAIYPKNCFKDGQATNCHINALITQCKNEISLYVWLMDDEEDIIETEAELLSTYEPPWNIQGV